MKKLLLIVSQCQREKHLKGGLFSDTLQKIIYAYDTDIKYSTVT